MTHQRRGQLSYYQIMKVQDRLDGQSGNVLNWKTAYEAFEELLRQEIPLQPVFFTAMYSRIGMRRVVIRRMSDAHAVISWNSVQR